MAAGVLAHVRDVDHNANCESGGRMITDSDSINPKEKGTHAIFFDDSPVAHTHVVAAKIAAGLQGINERALRAGMVILSTQTIQSSYCTPGGFGHVCTTIICQWMDRDALASMQRQQQLMGGK